MGQYGEDFKFWSESKDCACQQRPYLAEGRASVALPLRGALQGRHELMQLRGHRLAHDDHPIDGPRQEQMRDLLTQRICFLPLKEYCVRLRLASKALPEINGYHIYKATQRNDKETTKSSK